MSLDSVTQIPQHLTSRLGSRSFDANLAATDEILMANALESSFESRIRGRFSRLSQVNEAQILSDAGTLS